MELRGDVADEYSVGSTPAEKSASAPIGWSLDPFGGPHTRLDWPDSDVPSAPRQRVPPPPSKCTSGPQPLFGPAGSPAPPSPCTNQLDSTRKRVAAAEEEEEAGWRGGWDPVVWEGETWEAGPGRREEREKVQERGFGKGLTAARHVETHAGNGAGGGAGGRGKGRGGGVLVGPTAVLVSASGLGVYVSPPQPSTVPRPDPTRPGSRERTCGV